MKILSSLKSGLNCTILNHKIIWLLYAAPFLIAFAAALPITSLLEESVGNSMLISDLVVGFNYEFLNDFKNNYAFALNPLVNQSLFLMILFLLFQIFISGGIISVYLKNSKIWEGELFWSRAAQFFWRILRLFVFFSILQILILILFLGIYYFFVSNNFKNESMIVYYLKIIAPFYIFLVTIVLMIQDLTRIQMVNNNTSVFSALLNLIKIPLLQWFSYYGLYLFNGMIWIGLMVLSILMSQKLNCDDFNSILLSFLSGQLLFLLRTFQKLFHQSSLCSLSNAFASE